MPNRPDDADDAEDEKCFEQMPQQRELLIFHSGLPLSVDPGRASVYGDAARDPETSRVTTWTDSGSGSCATNELGPALDELVLRHLVHVEDLVRANRLSDR